MVVLETADLNATELTAYYRERVLFTEQVYRWLQAASTWPELLCWRHLMQMQIQC